MFKKSILALGVIAMVFSAVTYVSAQAKGEKGVLVGTVIEITSYAMKGLGEETIEGHKNRAEHGFPVGLLEDETGVVWICTFRSSAPASHLETANERLIEYINGHDGVKWMTFEEIAIDFRQRFPFAGGKRPEVI